MAGAALHRRIAPEPGHSHSLRQRALFFAVLGVQLIHRGPLEPVTAAALFMNEHFGAGADVILAGEERLVADSVDGIVRFAGGRA